MQYVLMDGRTLMHVTINNPKLVERIIKWPIKVFSNEVWMQGGDLKQPILSLSCCCGLRVPYNFNKSGELNELAPWSKGSDVYK